MVSHQTGGKLPGEPSSGYPCRISIRIIVKGGQNEIQWISEGRSIIQLQTKYWKIRGPRNMLYSIVQSTISMRSMLMLGGLGGCPPEKF